MPWEKLCEAVACLNISIKRGEIIALPRAANAGVLQTVLQSTPSPSPENAKPPEP